MSAEVSFPPCVSIFHHALTRAGGMERYAICIARAFRQAGSRVVFYTAELDSSLASELRVEVVKLSSFSVFKKLREWRFARQVRGAAVNAPGLQIALSRVPVRDIVICGGTHHGFLNATNRSGGFLDRLQLRLEIRAYESARVVVSHSELCTRELQRCYKISAEKIRTIYPPVESRFSPGDIERSRRELGLPLDKTVLLFPSTGHKRKGLPELCAALEVFKEDIVLAVAGNAVDIKSSLVQSLGYIKDMEVAYRAADFTILGSWYEPFGLVGPESVLCGTRLIFEENIGCLTALGETAAQRFSIRNRESIRDAVVRALRMKTNDTHRIADGRKSLLYDPDPLLHVSKLVEAAAHRIVIGQPS